MYSGVNASTKPTLQNQKVMVTLRKVPKWNDPSREINECVKIVKRDGTDW